MISENRAVSHTMGSAYETDLALSGLVKRTMLPTEPPGIRRMSA